MCLKASTLHNWYKNHLSGFNSPEEQAILHEHDIECKGAEPIAVPVLKSEHMGPSMAIDEKYIAGKFYTVLSNNETGKIAMLASTVKSYVLNEIIPKLGNNFKVEYLTRDLAQNFDWVGRTNFMNASHIADKFHIHKHLLESLTAVRVYYRQELLTKKREARQLALEQGKPYRKPKEETLENGDTPSQLLARSRHLLFKQQSSWSSSQKERAVVLFKYYPNLLKAYKLALEFRNWYKPSMIGKPMKKIKEKLQQWYERVDKAKIIELLNFKAMVQRHEAVICHYFLHGHTNAKAEAINRLIKSIVNNHTSIRNLDFAHFRLKTLLS